MSVREKSAWISLISILFFVTVYFGRLVAGGPGSGSANFITFVIAVAGVVILEAVLHIVIALRSPREARTPKDERERLIEMRATQLAFPVLLIGALASIWTLHTNIGRSGMAHAVLFAIVVAELVKFSAQIAYHRRGF